jgi:hypothetical protein
MDHPHRTGAAVPRAARLLVAAVVIALAATAGLAGIADVASAEPPLSLSATPNPVVIPYGETTGRYDLSWSTGSAAPAQFTLSVDNGPQYPFTQISAGTTWDIPIDIGQSHTYRLFVKGSRIPVRVVTVTTKRPDQSCLSQCIKAVEVTPHGSYAEFHVIATGPLKSYVLDVQSLGGADAGMFGVAGQEWTTTAWHLTPDEIYTYTLTVWDEAGNEQQEVGFFKTLRPRVEVTFDSITVANDSDALSEGEITWIFRTGDFWDPTSPLDTTVESGQTFAPGYANVVEPNTADLVIGLYGADDDEEDFPITVDACGEGVWPEPNHDPGTGSNGCGEWATAYTAVPVLVDGVGESFTAPFALGVSEDVMSFLAHGTYTVTYV